MALATAVLASMWFRGLRLESHQQRADQCFLLGDLFGVAEVVRLRWLASGRCVTGDGPGAGCR
jgi:hypothetical protein